MARAHRLLLLTTGEPMSTQTSINGAAKPASLAKHARANEGQEIILGGKPRKLTFNLYAFCRLDEETGKNILTGDVFNSMRPRDLVELVWCGLITDEPELTIDDVAKEIKLSEIMQLPQVVQSGFESAMPPQSEEKKTKAKAKTQQ